MLRGLFVAVAYLLGGPGDPQSGSDVVRAMHDRYAGTWYHTLSFLQRNTAYLEGDSVEHSTWFERAAMPGRLRIDFRGGANAPPGDGVLFARDSLFVMRGDTVARASAFVHPLMLLGFDVYTQPAERTLELLAGLGFDLSTVREDTWRGRAAYVVGAKAGDLRTRQFWIDKERLLFVRMLEPSRRDSTHVAETQFNRYRPYGRGWVAEEVLFLDAGRRTWLEQYADVRVDVSLPEGVFDVRRWKETL
jgi:hypothetical protein